MDESGQEYLWVLREHEPDVRLHRSFLSFELGPDADDLDLASAVELVEALRAAPAPNRVRPPTDAIWTPGHIVWLSASGLLYARAREGAHVSESDVRSTFATASLLVASADLGVVIDIRGMGSMSRRAREFFRAANWGLPAALLVSAGPSTMVARFFMNMTRSDPPVRMFATEGAALHWLRTLPENVETEPHGFPTVDERGPRRGPPEGHDRSHH